jgi:hypothetical protein
MQVGAIIEAVYGDWTSFLDATSRMRTYADVCGRMRTYADVCSRMRR